MGTGNDSPGVKQQGWETDHSPPSSADVKNDGVIPLLPLKYSWRNVKLIKPRGNFTFYLTEWKVTVKKGNAISKGGITENFQRLFQKPGLTNKLICDLHSNKIHRDIMDTKLN
jgi:hypothetical protein